MGVVRTFMCLLLAVARHCGAAATVPVRGLGVLRARSRGVGEGVKEGCRDGVCGWTRPILENQCAGQWDLQVTKGC